MAEGNSDAAERCISYHTLLKSKNYTRGVWSVAGFFFWGGGGGLLFFYLWFPVPQLVIKFENAS